MPRARKPQPRKRGTIIPEGEGKYRLRVFIGKTVDGKREYASRLVEGTISQAQKAMTKLLGEIDTKTLARPTADTVATLVTRWLDERKANEIQDATMRNYRIQANTHIIPALGGIKVSELTTYRVQAWINSMAEQGLAYSSIRLAYVVLGGALTWALEANQIARHPYIGTALPKKLKAAKAEMKVFSPEEMHRFLAGIDQQRAPYARYTPLFSVLLYCGLRPSEALALKWQDIDMTTRQLAVRRALMQVSSGKWIERPFAKTAAGTRTLTIPGAAFDTLRQHRVAQAREQLEAGPAWQANDYVFSTHTGSHLSPHNVSRVWKKLCTLTGVPVIRLYDARHTATTLELMAGVDVKTVSRRRGHASAAFTLDTYGHVIDAMDSGAADAMDNLLRRQASNG